MVEIVELEEHCSNFVAAVVVEVLHIVDKVAVVVDPDNFAAVAAAVVVVDKALDIQQAVAAAVVEEVG